MQENLFVIMVSSTRLMLALSAQPEKKPTFCATASSRANQIRFCVIILELLQFCLRFVAAQHRNVPFVSVRWLLPGLSTHQEGVGEQAEASTAVVMEVCTPQSLKSESPTTP